MTETLYDSLRRASVQPNIKGNEWIRLSHFYDSISEDSRRELKEIEERELKGLKKRIIEKYAGRHQSVANVVDGNTTFYSYGEPIIEQAKKVEDRCKGRSFGLATKGMFLGNDPRNPNEMRESVEYLRQEQIIDTYKFFRTQIVLPEFAKRAIGGWNFSQSYDSVYLVPAMFGKMLAGSILGGYFGYQLIPSDEGTFLGIFAGTVLMGVSTIGTLGLENPSSERFLKQREKFENGLRMLDSEVREHFPLDSQVVGAA